LLRQDVTLLRRDVTTMRGPIIGQAKSNHYLLHDIRLMRAAMTDLAKEKITPGEIEVLHDDVSKLHAAVYEVKGRLDLLEGHAES